MAWMIEDHRQPNGRPRYLRIVIGNPYVPIQFTEDPAGALQFERKEDAEAFMWMEPTASLNCFASGHTFITH